MLIDFEKVRMRKIDCIFIDYKLTAKSIKNFKNLEYHILVIKHYFFLAFVTTVEVKMKKHLKKKDLLTYQKFLI